MRGLSIVLLGAVALAIHGNALPYSKIPESVFQSDGYHYKQSSANSNSNSYSQSNSDNAEISGVFGGQAFSGSKAGGYSTNGGSHSQSSSYSSGSLNGNVPFDLIGGSNLGSGFAAQGSGFVAPGNSGTGSLGLGDNGSNSASFGTSYGSSASGNDGSAGYTSSEGIKGEGYGSSGYGSSGAGTSGAAAGSGSFVHQVPSGFVPAGANSFGQGASKQGAVQYWWMGHDSPFGPHGKPVGGCTSGACTLAGEFDLKKGSGGAHSSSQGGQVGINVEGNPFLNKAVGSGFVSSGATFGHSGSAVSGPAVTVGPVDFSGNPFLSGAGGSSGSKGGSSSFAGSSAFAGSDSSAGSAGSGSYGSVGAGNPFLQPGSSFPSVTQAPVFVGPSSTVFPSTIGGSNPFLKPGSDSVVVTQIVPTVTISSGGQIVPGQHPSGHGLDNPFLKPGFEIPSSTPGVFVSQSPYFPSQSSSDSGTLEVPQFGHQAGGADGSLTVSCSGEGRICVSKNICINGKVKAHSGLTQVRTGNQQCNVDREVCCTIDHSNVGIVQGVTLPPISGSTVGVFASSSSSSHFGADNDQSNTNFGQFGSSGSSGQFGSSGQHGSSGSSGQFGSSGSSGQYGSSGSSGQFGSSGSSGQYGSSGSSGQFGSSGSSGQFGSSGQHGSSGSSGQFGASGSSGQFGASGQHGSSGSSGQFGASGSSGHFGSNSDQSKTNFGQSGQFGSSGSSGQFGASIGFGQSGSNKDTSKTTFGQSGQFGSSSSSSAFGQSGSNYDQSKTGFGQTGQFGSSGSFGQSGSNSDQSKTSFGQSGQFGSSGHTGQDAASSNFGSFTTVKTSFGTGANSGSQGGSGLINTRPTISSNLIGGNTGYGTGNKVSAGAASNTGLIQTATGQSNGGIFGFSQNKNEQSGGLFGSVDNSGEDLSSGDLFSSGGKKTGSAESNGYLPPLGGDSSVDVPAFARPPQEGEPREPVPVTRAPTPRPTPFAPAPEVPVQVGCAAALICVEVQFCTQDGIISPEPVTLTSEQIERRVPLSSCQNPDNGVIGKCCRDPNYVDPWPTGNLPANYSGGFDEQGFPSYLNIAKTRPPKRPVPSTKTQYPTKTFPSSQRFPTIPPAIANFPNQISNAVSNIPNYFKPTEKPGIPTAIPEISINPGIPNSPPEFSPVASEKPPGFFDKIPSLPDSFPSFPSFPIGNPFTNGKTNYEVSPTNQNPVIAPHVPGSQCGLKNKVQRPSGLSDVDVAFGEIPWQAMVLSTKDRKLLCSGAIIAPDAIATAAHCVFGLQPSEVSIKSGEWKLGYELKHEEPLPFEIVKVASIAFHPGYYPDQPSHDLAILFLEHPVVLDQHVDLLCLGNSPQPKPNRKCIATGWGKVVLQVNVAGSLMHSVDVDLLSPDVCKQRLQGAENLINVDDSLVCTKAQKQSNNMCQVDVGGPLACDRGDGFYELTGVYSQDTGCLPTNQVATFALIDTEWVKKTLQSPPPPSQKIDTGFPEGESQSPSNLDQQIQPQAIPQQQKPCDCAKSSLPPQNNQYLPPL